MAAGITWVPLSRGDPLPTDVVVAGETKSDGVTLVGRFAGEAGKVNLPDGKTVHGGSMYNYWGPSQSSRTSCEVLRCSSDAIWLSIQRGQPIPEGAVQAGITSSDGINYVGRFNGEAGKINTRDGTMFNFWGHYWKDRRIAEILVVCDDAGSIIKPNRPSVIKELPGCSLRRQVSARAAVGYVAKGAVAVAERTGCLERSAADNNNAVAMPVDYTLPAFDGTLKILQFNIWQEGTEVKDGLSKIVDVIIASEADVVALSEVRNYVKDLHQRLKERLLHKGLVFHGNFVQGGDVGLLSRWPIDRAEQVTSATRSTITAYFLRTPEMICVCSAHLDWKQYSLNLVRGYDGNTFSRLSAPVTEVDALHKMDLESGRRGSIEDFLKFAENLCDMPVFLAGDFNECSHLDWTESTKDKFGHNGVVIDWKHSQMLFEGGFSDSWRDVHPDPVTHLGATWPSDAFERRSTSWAQEADERDRIDFIYYRGEKTRPVRACLVGSRNYFVKNVLHECDTQCPFLPATESLPWPSDHKGVLVEFQIGSRRFATI
eukprot:TRINITY_DN19028_c2_g2_i1.p1 TRINITY_DN19028_c2_g2~~TRINITY_DN19028_c2_g2_i1.p1  ORF type:complete len:543 (-),score=76.69 TRINITY_DN19028_c2_g2_i1:502-2130(-)